MSESGSDNQRTRFVNVRGARYVIIKQLLANNRFSDASDLVEYWPDVMARYAGFIDIAGSITEIVSAHLAKHDPLAAFDHLIMYRPFLTGNHEGRNYIPNHLALVAAQAGNPDGAMALEVLERASRLFEDTPEHRYLGWPALVIAETYAEIGKPDQGHALLERNQAWISEKSRPPSNPKDAERQSRFQAEQLNSAHLGALIRTATALARRGRIGEAVALAESHPQERDTILDMVATAVSRNPKAPPPPEDN